METLLVVDDDVTVVSLCQNILKLGGYAVLSASSGSDAVRIAQKATIDLALIDVVMPGMNGVELASRIQSERPSVKILLMTGFGPRDIAPLMNSHDYRVIWKPFKTESLLRMVENALGFTTPLVKPNASSARNGFSKRLS